MNVLQEGILPLLSFQLGSKGLNIRQGKKIIKLNKIKYLRLSFHVYVHFTSHLKFISVY